MIALLVKLLLGLIKVIGGKIEKFTYGGKSYNKENVLQ